MRSRFTFRVLVLALFGTPWAVLGDPVAYTFQTIVVPGGGFLFGINNAARIVGISVDSFGDDHGVVYSNGAFTPLNEDSFATSLTGINDAGQIVGFAGGHGFLYTNGVFTDINLSATYGTRVNGVNNADQMTIYMEYVGSFVYTNGVVTPIRIPGAGYVFAVGINNKGQIAGTFADNTGEYGFLDTNGIVTTLHPPGAELANASGINDSGQVVGHAAFGVNDNHGFIYSDGVFTRFDVPGAGPLGTFPEGINNKGQIVGYFLDASNIPYGFIATPVPEPWQLGLTTLGLLGIAARIRRSRKHANYAQSADRYLE